MTPEGRSNDVLRMDGIHHLLRDIESVIHVAVAAERERCARIADEWAKSKSCSPEGACEHIRTSAAIAAEIRKGE